MFLLYPTAIVVASAAAGCSRDRGIYVTSVDVYFCSVVIIVVIVVALLLVLVLVSVAVVVDVAAVVLIAAVVVAAVVHDVADAGLMQS